MIQCLIHLTPFFREITKKKLKNVRIPHSGQSHGTQQISQWPCYKRYLVNSKLIYRLWSPSSSDMNLCNYYLCGPPKDRADVNNSFFVGHERKYSNRNSWIYKDQLCYVMRYIFSKAKPAEKQEVGTSRLLHKIKLYCRKKLTLNSWQIQASYIGSNTSTGFLYRQ